MAHVNVVTPDLEFEDPILIDGLPGKGLVGKLIADYLVTELEMEYYAGVHCESLPAVAAYRPTDSQVRPPIQLYADAERDLMTLVSDVPISTANAPDFADCISNWLHENAVTPIFNSGLPERVTDGGDDDGGDAPNRLYGLSTGDGDRLLAEADITAPHHAGIVTGPTGALLNRAADEGLDSVGLLVEITDDLPDYASAATVIDRGVNPITGMDIDTAPFEDQSIEMSSVAESALQTLGDSSDGSAKPTPTFY